MDNKAIVHNGKTYEVLETEILSADNVKHIALELESETKVEVLVQKIDKKTGQLASRSRSLQPEIVENVVVRDIPKEGPKKIDFSNPSSHISEEERQSIIAGKMASIKERHERNEETMRYAQLDEDDEKEEESKSETQREIEKSMIERNQEASKNVDEVRELKAELEAQGKSKSEIKAAVKELKSEQKKRGRPAADALKNPVKNPETGEFEEGQDGE